MNDRLDQGGNQAQPVVADGQPDDVAAAQDIGSVGQTVVQVDDAKATTCYANFCRVSSTPEELILDLGLNSQSAGSVTQPIQISQRVILNHFTAKRLLGLLQQALVRHENAFGVVEIDVRKRVKNK